MCLGNNLYSYLCVCLGNLALEEEGDNSGRCSDTRLQCLTPVLNIHTKSTKSTARYVHTDCANGLEWCTK